MIVLPFFVFYICQIVLCESSLDVDKPIGKDHIDNLVPFKLEQEKFIYPKVKRAVVIDDATSVSSEEDSSTIKANPDNDDSRETTTMKNTAETVTMTPSHKEPKEKLGATKSNLHTKRGNLFSLKSAANDNNKNDNNKNDNNKNDNNKNNNDKNNNDKNKASTSTSSSSSNTNKASTSPSSSSSNNNKVSSTTTSQNTNTNNAFNLGGLSQLPSMIKNALNSTLTGLFGKKANATKMGMPMTTTPPSARKFTFRNK